MGEGLEQGLGEGLGNGLGEGLGEDVGDGLGENLGESLGENQDLRNPGFQGRLQVVLMTGDHRTHNKNTQNPSQPQNLKAPGTQDLWIPTSQDQGSRVDLIFMDEYLGRRKE